MIKIPIGVVTEAIFLGVIFDRTSSYKNQVNYLKTNRLRGLDILKVVGQTDWEADRKTTLPLSIPNKNLNWTVIFVC